MPSRDREHQLLSRLYGAAPAAVHRLERPAGDPSRWQARCEDRRGEVVFGVLRDTGDGERMLLTRGASYPPGIFRVPSGGIGRDETVIDALWREVAEELAVPFRVVSYAGLIDYRLPLEPGEPVRFPSYCFLLEEIGAGPSLTADGAGPEIAALRAVGIGQVVEQAAALGDMGAPWADWGEFRSVSTARLARAWARHRANTNGRRRSRTSGLLDLTHPVGAGGVAAYPGEQPPSSSLSMARPVGAAAGWQVTRWEFSAHAGTHVDAPAHLIGDGATVDQLDLGRLSGPAMVFDARRATAAGRPARADDLVPADLEAARNRIALIKFGLSREMAAGAVPPELPGLSPELAGALVALQVRAVGTDALSVDPYGGGAAHNALLGAGVPVIELLDLSRVPEGPCSFSALPLRLLGSEAAPCRAVCWLASDDDPGAAN